MHSGRSDCKASTLQGCIDIPSVERAGLNIPFTCAGVSWLALLRQKQLCPLRASSLSPSYTKRSEAGSADVCARHCSRLAVPTEPCDSSPGTRNKQAWPLRRVPRGVRSATLTWCTQGTPPSPPLAPLGSHDASCLLHSFPECLGPARKLTIVSVPRAFCSVLMSNSCN